MPVADHPNNDGLASGGADASTGAEGVRPGRNASFGIRFNGDLTDDVIPKNVSIEFKDWRTGESFYAQGPVLVGRELSPQADDATEANTKCQ